MRARLAGVCVFVAGVFWLTGCGGGGAANPVTPGGSGQVRGNLGGQAAGGTVQLDGTDLRANVQPDGSFSLEGVPPGEYTLSVTGAGGQGAALMIRVEGDQTTTIGPVTLQAAGQIAGLVTVAGTGAPIAGARVVARYVPLLWDYAPGAAGNVLDGVASAGGSASRQAAGDDGQRPPPRVAVTDADGSFRFTGVKPGPYAIEVTADNHEGGETGTWVDAGRTAVADVTLIPVDPNNAELSGTLSGRRDGRTLPLAQVYVGLYPVWNEFNLPPGAAAPPERPTLNEGDDIWYCPPFAWGKSTMTDEQGRYALRNIVPGEYWLSIYRFGYESVELRITLSERETRTLNRVLDYILTTISGTIYARDRDGSTRPLAGAWVSAWGTVVEPGRPLPVEANGAAGVAFEDLPGTMQTGPDGRYEVAVQAGQVSVYAWAEGYVGGERTLAVNAAGATGVDLTLTPRARLDVTIEAPANVALGADVDFTVVIANNDTLPVELWGPPFSYPTVYGATGEWIWGPLTVMRQNGDEAGEEPGEPVVTGFPNEPRVLQPGQTIRETFTWPTGDSPNGARVTDGWYFIGAGVSADADYETVYRAVAVGTVEGPAPSFPPQWWGGEDPSGGGHLPRPDRPR